MEAINIKENDSGETTLHGYLKQLLLGLWLEGERFSSKRPFGNSGWEFDIYQELVKIDAVNGKLDEDGYVEEIDIDAAKKFVAGYIEEIFNKG